MRVFRKDKTIHIVPACDLVASNVEKLRDSIINKLKKEEDVDLIVFNAKGIEVVDSLGVNLIIGTYQETKSRSVSFQVTNANEKFMKISDFFKFEDFFTVSTGSKAK